MHWYILPHDAPLLHHSQRSPDEAQRNPGTRSHAIPLIVRIIYDFIELYCQIFILGIGDFLLGI